MLAVGEKSPAMLAFGESLDYLNTITQHIPRGSLAVSGGTVFCLWTESLGLMN